MIEHVLRLFFPGWIEHCQALYHPIARRACRNSVCNCITPLRESLIHFPRFLVGIDIPKVGEIEVRSSERAPNQHIYKPGALQLRPIERCALQLRPNEPRALQLRPIERCALQLRPNEPRALQLRLIEPRALQLRPNERRALQLRPNEHRALQLRPIELRALQLRPNEPRALQLRLKEPRALQLRPGIVKRGSISIPGRTLPVVSKISFAASSMSCRAMGSPASTAAMNSSQSISISAMTTAATCLRGLAGATLPTLLRLYHAARWEWRDQPHRPRRIDLRASEPRYCRERSSARGQMQEVSAVGKFHRAFLGP